MGLLTTMMAAMAMAAGPLPAEPPIPVLTGGRVIRAADGSASFGWPGVYFEARVRGPGVRLAFEAPEDFLRVLVDGQEVGSFRRPGRVDVTFDQLGDGEHVIRLEKQTESQQGGSRLIGFWPAAGSTALPPRPRARQIEFIGDSYTVGYGNTSTRHACPGSQVHDTTDTQQAFGPLVARAFDADYRINAYSGFGVVRNYDGGSADLSLPAIYPRLKPDSAAPVEGKDPAWTPGVIVINLGTNDFSTPVKPGERWADEAALKDAYVDRYVAFVRMLRARDPQARFVLMASDAFLAEVRRVEQALDPAAAPGRVAVVRFGELDLKGCDFHPSLADDRRMATLLTTAITDLAPGWRATTVAAE